MSAPAEQTAEFAELAARIAKFKPGDVIAVDAGDLQAILHALRAIAANAESWHMDEAGKSRALAVIAGWANHPSTVPAAVGTL